LKEREASGGLGEKRP